MRKLDVLVACEESQAVCKAFRKLGHNAFSCDLQKCSGGHPEWHIISDVVPLLDGYCYFLSQNMDAHKLVLCLMLMAAQRLVRKRSPVLLMRWLSNGVISSCMISIKLLIKRFCIVISIDYETYCL